MLLRTITDAPWRGTATTKQARSREQPLQLLRAELVVTPRYTYRFVDIDRIDAGVLTLRGVRLAAP